MTKSCVINSRKYTFTDIRNEFGTLRGYCKKKRKWAWLFKKYVQFDNEEVVFVEWIS